MDGGIEVTASHNPINYNGMKLVKAGSVPISGDTGLNAIKVRAEALSDEFVSGRLSHYTSGAIIDAEAFFNGLAHIQLEKLEETDQYLKQSCIDDYVAHMLSYVELNNFTPP